MLCGITIRFQKLSHSQRQVTHVLLTRPPLRISKQASIFSVRLACVKRAASVRPEPGSNSLFKLYIQTLRVFISILAITIRSQLPLWFFCLFWLLKVPISWNLKGFFACSALFNFQDTFEAAFVLQLLYYITFRSFCQVNILWTEVQPVFFSFLLAVTSFSILSHSVDFVKWTFLEQLQPLTVDLPIRFTVSLVLYSLNFRSRATALLYHAFSHLSSKYL